MKTRKALRTAAEASEMFHAAVAKEQNEERVYVLPLDANGGVLAKPIVVSVGHRDGTTDIDVGAMFRAALKAGAEEIIVAHNHPSGNLTPSKADWQVTEKMREAARLLGVKFLDHLIIATGGEDDKGFVSLAEMSDCWTE